MEALFRVPPLLLQSRDMNDEDLNTINSHIKYNILDISHPDVNHGVLTVDEPTTEEIELRSLLSEWNLEVLADEFISIRLFLFLKVSYY